MRLSQEAIQRMFSGRSGGGGGGGSFDPSALAGYATQAWTEENYISKTFFNELFIIHKKVTTVVMDGETEISRTVTTNSVFAPNEIPGTTTETDEETGYVTTVTTDIASIESKKGFWTNYFISALGLNSEGGGGGLALNEPLSTINVSGLSDHPSSSGQTIVWNGSAWTYGTAGGSGMTYTFATGDANGQFNVTPSSGTAYNVSIKGLAALAYKASLAVSDIPDLSGRYLPLTGGTMTGAITRNSGGWWAKAREHAIIRTTASNSDTYYASFSLKTVNGDWSVGVIADTDKLYAVYTTDTVYEAGSNNHIQIMFPQTSGTLAMLTDNIASATKLNDDNPYTAWGQTFFTGGKPKSISNTYMTGVTNIDSLLYFDTTNNRIGVGKSSPSYAIDVNGTAQATTLRATDIYIGGIHITADNNGIHINSAGLYADTYVSALGLSDSGGSGGIDWDALAANTNEQINVSHLTTALAPYALTSQIPTSLKNPYKLTITLNGTATEYDGSAARSLTINTGLDQQALTTYLSSKILTIKNGTATIGTWNATAAGTIDIASALTDVVKYKDVGTGSVDAMSGSFFFGGVDALQSGYDYVGFQAGNSADKWQMTAIGSLRWRQNDNGGTDSSNWSDWRTILDTSNWTSTINLSSLGAASTSELNNYLPLSAGSGKPLTGSLYLSSLGKGVFAPYTVSGSTVNIPLIYDNGTNLWIGATETAANHHIGSTYISAGHGGTAGNSTIYICVPNAANTSGTNYGVLHGGNYTDWVYSKSQIDTQLTNLVANGTANRLAYYTAQRAIGQTNNILLMPNTTNSVNAYQNGLRIWGTCYGNSSSTLLSGMEGLITYGDGGPQIIFSYGSTDSSQSGALLFTDNDSCGEGASFHFLSNQSDWNVNSKRFVARSSVTIGQNTPNTNYALYTSGNAYFTSRIYLASGVYLEYNGNGGVHLVGAGFYSDSYVSALGLSDSSGSVSSLSDLTDVSISSLNNGQGLVYDSSSGKWKNATLFTALSYSSNMLSMTISGVTKTVTIQAGSSGVTSVATGTGLTGGTITSTGTISINSTYQTYISNGNTAYGWGDHSLAGYLTTTIGDKRYPSLVPFGGTTITSNSNLNNILTCGTYVCNAGSIATTLSNTPYKDGNFRLYHLNNTGQDGTQNQWGAQFIVAGNENRLFYRGVTTSNNTAAFNSWVELLHTGNYSTQLDGRYLKLSGGTMTGPLYVATGIGINDATGNGLLVYHPTNWTGITSSQWGVGAVDCQGIIRSSATDLKHYRGGTLYNIVDNLYHEKAISSEGWYRVANVTNHGASLLLSIRRNFYNGEPAPANFIISHTYTHDSVIQVGGSAMKSVGVTKVRLMRYEVGKIYIEIYYSRNDENTVGIEITPLGHALYNNIALVDFTKITSTSGLTLADSTPISEGNVNGVTYTKNGGIQGPDYFGRSKVGFLMSNQTVNGDSSYKNWMYMDCYNSTDAGGATAIGVSRTTGRMFVMQSDSTRESWNTMREVVVADTTGNVGIGTSSPNYKLHVNGEAMVANSIYTNGHLIMHAGSTGIYLNSSGTGIDWHNSSNQYVASVMAFSQTQVNVTASAGLKIGNAVLQYESSTNSLKLVHATNGASVNFYATGGVSALGMSGNADGTISGNLIPSSSGTYTLGSASKGWTNIYLYDGDSARLNIYADSAEAWYDCSSGKHNFEQPIAVTGSGYFTTTGYFGGKVSIGGTNSNSDKLYVNGSMRSSGISYASSHNNTSDARLKNIIGYEEVDVETIAHAPLIKFTWKDGNSRVHIGTTAQYWLGTELHDVIEQNDYLSMDYATTALAGVISVARKVMTHEERIAALEAENERLRNEIETLKAA